MREKWLETLLVFSSSTGYPRTVVLDGVVGDVPYMLASIRSVNTIWLLRPESGVVSYVDEDLVIQSASDIPPVEDVRAWLNVPDTVAVTYHTTTVTQDLVSAIRYKLRPWQ